MEYYSADFELSKLLDEACGMPITEATFIPTTESSEISAEYPSFSQVLEEAAASSEIDIGEILIPATPEPIVSGIKIHQNIQIVPPVSEETYIIPESPMLVEIETPIEKVPKTPKFILKRKRTSTTANGKRIRLEYSKNTCNDSEAMKLRETYPAQSQEDTVLGTIECVVASNNNDRIKHPIFTIPGKEHSIMVDSPQRFLIFDLAHMADDHIGELRRISQECELPMHLKYNFEYEDNIPFEYDESPVLQCALINKMYSILGAARKSYTGKLEKDEFWFENLLLKLRQLTINFCGNGKGVTLPLIAIGGEKVYLLTALIRKDIIIGVAFVQVPKNDVRIYNRLNGYGYAPVIMDGIYYPPHWSLMGMVGVAKKGSNVRFEDLASVETTLRTRKHRCMGQYDSCDSSYIANSTGIFTLFTNTLLKNKVVHINCF